MPSFVSERRWFLQNCDIHYFAAVCTHTVMVCPCHLGKLNMHQPGTEWSQCLYLLKYKNVLYLAWSIQHFCFDSINYIVEKNELVSTLCYTENSVHQKLKDRFRHPAPSTSHSAPAWRRETCHHLNRLSDKTQAPML